MEYDFSGWATRNDIKCSDGRTIKHNAFIEQDGKKVPLVWNHQHNEPNNVLGHAILENRDDGVYAYGTFNDTEAGQAAKELVVHGDVTALSIFANDLKQDKSFNVLHGSIREVSLVLAGANIGAFIDNVICHGEDSIEEAIIYSGEQFNLEHGCVKDEDADKKEKKPMVDEEKKSEEKPIDDKPAEEKPAEEPKKEIEHSDDNETVADVYNSLSDKQKTVVDYMISEALKDNSMEHSDDDDNDKNLDNNEGDENIMKHNVFDNKENKANSLAHAEIKNIVEEARSHKSSLRDAFLAHGYSEDTLEHSVTDDEGNAVTYGIANVDYLFPDARTVSNTPDFISRDMSWVTKVISGAKHLPFSRVKSIHADITMDEARAKGYIKGNEKANEVFSLLKRTTSPTTIYKKQKLDRDDVIDITDFDVVVWLKQEMRIMLNEEIARAALLGDGRVAGSDDKISEDNIRPIYSDNATYTVKVAVTPAAGATDDDITKACIRQIIKSRKNYKGSGNVTFFTTEDFLTDCLLLEDGNGRVIYDTEEKLRTALRVKEIVTVEPMENVTRTVDSYDYALKGIYVNMNDYGFGADKGGAVNMFDDFDIDFNQMKYLIETRCSGALMKYHSAVVIEVKTAHSAG